MQAYRLVRRAPAPDEPRADRLDSLQANVVAHSDGPLLVLGGPGTGKTDTLVAAVAARVASGVDPERVLVLTFSRRAAGALRNRIESQIAAGDGRVVHEPLVRTFAAYAFGILRRAAALRGEPSPRLLTGPEQDLVIRELLDVVGPDENPIGWPEHLQPALRTRAFAEQLRDLLMRAAERGIGPVELARLGERLGRDDWPAAARFLREYVAVLALRDATTRGSVAYDAAELVRAATGLLDDDPELLATERGRLDTVYVDELADTDPAQLDLLHRVAGGGTPLVAFADPDSSTFAFRGADPSGVTTFPHRFRTASGAVARTVTLRTDYRTSGPLFEATGRVARRLRGPVGHRRAIPAGEAGKVEVRTFRSRTSEAAFLAHALREAHLIDGVPWSRMAVLMRSTTLQLPSLQRALHSSGVPTVVHAEDLPLHQQPAVAPLLLLLRCALEPAWLDEEAAVALLHSPLGGADPLAERRLRQGLRTLALAAGDRRPSGELLVEALRDPSELAAVERRWAAPAKSVARLLAAARSAAASPGANAEDVLWALWRATGLGDRWYGAIARAGRATGEPDNGPRWRAAAADRDLDAVVVLFDAAARFVDRLPGARTEVFLDHVLGQQLPADTIAPSADRGDAVRLLTAHAAKGLEWDLVAVAGVQEGVWPDLRLRGTLLGSERLVDVVSGRADGTGVAASLVGQASALLDEERRLFYVAVTRARQRLLVSAVNSSAVGGADHEEQPSRFLHELLGPTGGAGTDGDGLPPDPDDDVPPDPDGDPRLDGPTAQPRGRDGLRRNGAAPNGGGDPRVDGPQGRAPHHKDTPSGDLPADGQARGGEGSRRTGTTANGDSDLRLDGPPGPPDPDGPPAQPHGGGGPRRGGATPGDADYSASGGDLVVDDSDLPAEPEDLPPDPDDLPVDDDGRVIWPEDWAEETPPGESVAAPVVVRQREDYVDELPLARPPRAMTLSALVAELRTAATDPAATPTRRRAAAGELARLAAAGVPGAHPDDWWGLRPLSDDRPLTDEGETVRVTPSTMESALRCSLRWLLERHGGAAPASAAQGIGNLVHAAAMLAEDAAADRERLIEYVAARFDAIDLAARWLAGPERERAEAMVDKLLHWLAANPRRLLAIEQEFAVRLDDPTRPVELRGRVDRLEVDAEGRLVVVDLKTGRTTSTADDLAEHPQLAAYQAAVQAGAFDQHGDEPGGAALVQLGTSAKAAKEQVQPSLTEGEDPGWAQALVRRTAETMAASTFHAIANSRCRVCPVRTSCPISGKGRQVVEPQS
ncbi:superfamily I DNA/RNA helicase [Asanoa ferruginea]|uniref:DNA 3'-5' helicase n=1 Tax=Asanoa ferruginea TaxID=53367 RepID=A0A3D9ZJU5_9ACTN|nr:ATP-dependent DNA helicase [Asanoa ferruginea]REF97119.1 superfamily I DNA/RNA helicase [Asanoa ferruginea]